MEKKIFCKECCKEISKEMDTQYKGYCYQCYKEKNKINNSGNIKQEKKQFGCIIALFIIIVFIVFFFITTSSNKKNTSKPNEIELMSYAQFVLDDNLPNPSYSHYKGDYTFVGNNLRYKIEGTVTLNNIKKNFWMIIEFDDNTYKNYELISLQIDNEIIYKKQ